MVRRAENIAWRPVVAAGRLGDNILEEKRRLCAIVDAAARADSERFDYLLRMLSDLGEPRPEFAARPKGAQELNCLPSVRRSR